MKIAVASGKGGTGKTMVSTNLFQTVRKSGIPVSIVDCDAEEPNVREFISSDTFCSDIVTQKIPVIDQDKCTYCSKCHDYCNYNAIICLPPAKFIKVIEELCHDCGACLAACEIEAITEKSKELGTINSAYLNSYAELIEGCTEIGVYSPVPVIKQAIHMADKNPLNIFDSPPGISCPFIATVNKADYVVLVTEPTPFGLNDLKLSVETLYKLKKPFGIIINRAGLGYNDIYDWISENKITILAEIPFDREIARIYSEGRLLVDENGVFASLFSNLLKEITNQIKEN